MRETPVQKQASLHPAVVEGIGKTGEVPTVKVRRGPRGPYGPRKKPAPQVSHTQKVGRNMITFYRTDAPQITLSQAEIQSLLDKRMMPVIRKAASKPGYTRVEIVDHETVFVR
jgi:hypothetical protein